MPQIEIKVRNRRNKGRTIKGEAEEQRDRIKLRPTFRGFFHSLHLCEKSPKKAQSSKTIKLNA